MSMILEENLITSWHRRAHLSICSSKRRLPGRGRFGVHQLRVVTGPYAGHSAFQEEADITSRFGSEILDMCGDVASYTGDKGDSIGVAGWTGPVYSSLGAFPS
jgi:hypothetical protein